MSDFVLVDPQGWEYDLHSVYSAWIGHFQVQNIPWYERTWGHVFSSFNDFLESEWPVIVVTDARTGKAHVVTRFSSIEGFLKMIKTRFGEILHHPPNLVTVTPFETTSRPLRRVNDQSSYAKIHISLPAATFSAFRTRVREGDPKAVEEVWKRRDKTFLALDFEWSERNEKSVLEWGYAAVRCGFLDTQGRWPPEPDLNYRKGHFVVADYIDKVINKFCPNHPWDYAFGDTQIISKPHLSKTLGAIFTSLASPDSDTHANELVLVGHGIAGDIKRLEELKIKIPRNMLLIDTALYERRLFQAGHRGPMFLPDPKAKNAVKPRPHNNTLSLEALLRSLPTTYTPSPNSPSSGGSGSPAGHNGHSSALRGGQRMTSLPGCVLHNAGNDAFMTLFALQKLLELDHTPLPSVKKRIGNRPGAHHSSHHHHSQQYHPQQYPNPAHGYGYPHAGPPYMQPNGFPPGIVYPVAVPVAMTGNQMLSAPTMNMSMQRMSRSLPLMPPQGMIPPHRTTPSPGPQPLTNLPPDEKLSPQVPGARPRSALMANRASPTTDSSSGTDGSGRPNRASSGFPFPGSMRKTDSRSRSPSTNVLGYTPGIGRAAIDSSEMGVLRSNGQHNGALGPQTLPHKPMHTRSKSSGVLLPGVKVSDEGEGMGGSLSKATGLERRRSRVMSSAGLMESGSGHGHSKEGSKGGAGGGSGRSTPAALVKEGGRRLSAMFR